MGLGLGFGFFCTCHLTEIFRSTIREVPSCLECAAEGRYKTDSLTGGLGCGGVCECTRSLGAAWVVATHLGWWVPESQLLAVIVDRMSIRRIWRYPRATTWRVGGLTK